MSFTANSITLYCILASCGLGLAVGLPISPLLVAVWNQKICKTKYYRELASDVALIRAASQTINEKLLLTSKVKENELDNILKEDRSNTDCSGTD